MSDNTSTDKPDGHEFPLQLVASVAATLLAGRRNGDKQPRSYLHIADQAVELLRACRLRLHNRNFFDHVRGRRAMEAADKYAQGVAHTVHREVLEEKFPQGVPWKKGLLMITGKKSEADALAPFRRWLQYEQSRGYARGMLNDGTPWFMMSKPRLVSTSRKWSADCVT